LYKGFGSCHVLQAREVMVFSLSPCCTCIRAQVGLRHGLPLLSPVDDAGCFTEEAGARFAGLQVQKEGNAAVIEALSEAKVLLKEEQYAHKYPYDWRTKKPTIFRATSQWFASVEGFRCAGQVPASATLKCCCKLGLQVLVAALFVFCFPT
jgi:valyl-tRNA synthetase